MTGQSTDNYSQNTSLIRASENDEDETAELQRELEKIKRERAEKREQEVRTNAEAPKEAMANTNAGERKSSSGRGC